MTHFTQPSDTSPFDYAKALWNMAPSCDHLYDKYILKSVSLDGRHESIGHSMRSYWVHNKNATVQNFVYHTTSLTSLRKGSPSSTSSSYETPPKTSDPIICESQHKRHGDCSYNDSSFTIPSLRRPSSSRRSVPITNVRMDAPSS